MPGLFPYVEDAGGMVLEWNLRMPSAGFESVSLYMLSDGTMDTSLLPDGRFEAERHGDVPMDAVKAFLETHLPEDDGM